MKRIRLLIVDDQRLFVESLRRVLLSEHDFVKEVFVATGGEQALHIADRVMPDVVLMDVFMSDLDGIRAARLLHDRHPQTTIIMLSAFGYDEHVQAAMQNGASGYVLKDIAPKELINTIAAIRGGGVSAVPRKFSYGRSSVSSRTQRDGVDDWYRCLSPKERQILLLISSGYSNREIAAHVNLGQQTVRNYVSTIYSKLNVKDRFGAMRKAIEARIQQWNIAPR